MATSYVTLLLIFVRGLLAFDDWEDEFEHVTELKDEEAILYWTPKTDECMIEFGLEVQTAGYAAIGISLSGSMAQSDIVLGWIDDETNEAYLYNYYAERNGRPSLFNDQSGIELIDAKQEDINGTITTFLRFEKQLFPSTFRMYGIDVAIGTSRVIYAFHANDPLDNNPLSIDKHANSDRSTKSLDLLTGNTPAVPMEADVQTYDLLQPGVEVPDADTTYMCTLLELPQFDETQHIVRVDPVIQEGHEALVHHILVYECPDTLADPSLLNQPWNCDDGPNMATNTTRCRAGSIKFAWAIGAGSFYLPEGVGMPVGGTDKPSYVLFETHFDNPQEIPGYVDNSGLRYFYTPTLREESAAIIHIGDGLDQFIPPGLDAVWNYAYFGGQCSDDGLPEEGVHIFANAHHQHLLGTAGIVRHIRDGVELPPIDVNLGYDFNFQQFVPKKEEILLLPGDEIIVECRIDSTSRDEMTYGGESTRHEMCQTFLVVYPIPDVSLAYSRFLVDEKQQFFDESSERGYWNEDGVYNISIAGALEFYEEFHNHSTERSLYCLSQESECLNPYCGEVLRPMVGFEEYESDYYFGCQNQAANESNGFEWDGWYTWVGLIVLIALIGLFGYCICRGKNKKMDKRGGYKTQLTSTANNEDSVYGATKELL